MRKVGLEPTRPKAQEPKSCVSANFTTPAGAISLLTQVWRSRRTIPVRSFRAEAVAWPGDLLHLRRPFQRDRVCSDTAP